MITRLKRLGNRTLYYLVRLLSCLVVALTWVVDRFVEGVCWLARQRIVRWAVRRYWPLLPWIASIYAVWATLEHHEFTPRDPIDGYILFGIGVAFLIAVVFMVLWTRHWTWRSLGQMAAYLGDSGLYLSAGGASLGWTGTRTEGQLNLIRSCFIVGGTLLVLGLLWWGWKQRGQSGQSDGSH